MTPARLARHLSAQTAQARKVFDTLLVDESMTIQQIRSVLVARNCHMAHNAIEGCLHSLNRVGLVIAKNGQFRAALEANPSCTQTKEPAAPTKEPEQEAPDMTAALEITIRQSSAITIGAKAESKPTEQAAAAPSNGLQAATERVAAIGDEVAEVVEGVRQKLAQLTSLSSELNDLAIQITLETDHVNDQIEKLGKVQALLRDLGVAA